MTGEINHWCIGLIHSFLRFANIHEIIFIVTVVFTGKGAEADIFLKQCSTLGHDVIRVSGASSFLEYPRADLFIDGLFNGYFAGINAPLFIHAPAFTFNTLKNVPDNCARFCAWPGFMDREIWEIAINSNDEMLFVNLLMPLGIKAKIVEDIPGLVAPRILCTIINEAAFTLSENIANEGDIDTAMKLGTNYPYGPIEWARLIGINEVKQVLTQMAVADGRYLPSAHLDKL
jgi:3-hydroxybutyryl-CoA dehydrogenase